MFELCRAYARAETLRVQDDALRNIRYALEQVGPHAASIRAVGESWQQLRDEGAIEEAEASALIALAKASYALFESRTRQKPGGTRRACAHAEEAQAAADRVADDQTSRLLACAAGIARLVACVDEDSDEEALTNAERLRAVAESAYLPGLVADLDHVVGVMLRRSGQPDAAGPVLFSALERYKLVGDRVGAARAEDTLGMVHVDLGNFEEAAFHFQRSFVGKGACGDKFGLALTAGNMGRLYLQLEEWEKARHFLDRDLALSREIGDETGELIALLEVSEALVGLRELASARHAIEEANALPILVGNNLARANTLYALSRLQLAQGDYDAALSTHRTARATFGESPRPFVEAQLNMQEGMIEAGRGNLRTAQDRLQEAMARFRALKLRGWLAKAQFECAMAMVGQGRPEAALPHLQEAIDEAEGLAAERMAARFREACQQVGTDTWLRTLLKVKRLNESLEEEQGLRESLVGTIVHDLRNTAAMLDMTIKTALASATEPAEPDEAALEVDLDSLHVASGQCELLVELVSSIVDAQKLEAGGLYTERHATALRPVIAQLVGFFRPAAREGVEVVEAADSEGVSALCDEAAVRRVLVNLLHNATKYTYPRDELEETLGSKGQISVGVRREGERARVWVQDTGTGIPAEFHERIFSKFGQVQPGMKQTSTGLGLYFCKLAIEAQGGEIGLESEVDVGSTFWFRLPLA